MLVVRVTAKCDLPDSASKELAVNVREPLWNVRQRKLSGCRSLAPPSSSEQIDGQTIDIVRLF